MMKKKNLKTETTDGEEGRRFTRLESKQRGHEGRRSTRLQSKLSTLPLNSSRTLKSCFKVSSSKAFPACSKHLKPHTVSVSAKRIKHREKGSKPRPDSPPYQDQESERPSNSNMPAQLKALIKEHTAPSLSKALKSSPKYVREADSSRTAASFVATRTEMVANVAVERLQERPNANPTTSYGLTEIANMFRNEDSRDDEAESSGWINITDKYLVKEALAPIVRRMIDKYGDIAANYLMETPKSRSVALENVAEFIQAFQSKKFADHTEEDIEEALKFVADFGKQRLNVGWLEEELKVLLEARKKAKRCPILKEKKDKLHELSLMLKEKKDKLDESIKKKKRSLENTKEELNVASAEIESINTILDEVKYLVDHPPLGNIF